MWKYHRGPEFCWDTVYMYTAWWLVYVCAQYMSELRASFGNSVDMWDHYDVLNKSHVDISNFGEYFITTIEMLLISQRKVHVRVRQLRWCTLYLYPKRIFRDITNPSSCLRHLLPGPREQSLTSRLRTFEKCPRTSKLNSNFIMKCDKRTQNVES